VYGVPVDAPSARAAWLAEVATALEQAQLLLTRIDFTTDGGAALVDLHVRIQAARLQVQSLRRSRSLAPGHVIDPKWSGFAPWTLDPS
jgi:hypothetical protein